MSANIPTHFVQQFADTLALLAQQEKSKLETTVDSGMHIGEQASPVDQWGKIAVSENNERFTEMPRVDAPLDRRWVIPTDFDLPQLVQNKDLIRMLTDPRSIMARDAIAAFNRQKDTTILQGLLLGNQTGKTGTTVTQIANSVSVNTGGAASKLNVSKVREAKRILMANDVDVQGEELYFVVNAAAHDALLNEIQVVSKDYNVARDGMPVMKEGLIDRFLGFNFIHCERVFTGTDDAAGTSSACVAYAKSGAYLGKWQDITTDVRERPDLRDIPTQIYVKATFGATRLDEAKVVRVWSR
jgi:hypothetical protein